MTYSAFNQSRYDRPMESARLTGPLRALARGVGVLASAVFAASAASAQAPSAEDATVAGERWTSAFEQKSAEAFELAFDDSVVLEAATLVKPVEGADTVKVVMETASRIYTHLEFTFRGTTEDKTLLQWEAEIPGGHQLKGVTVLTRNEEGLITRVGIYHSPLNSALAFSDEMGRRTVDVIGPGYFYNH